ncbi:neutral ceramidase [Harmonia axyridis]|uniref:neutral ceramidase n=1 Tax=Harmonia axyridis TaxID=115357 RepID=UPI001E275296|nr:neutral ceramidase [Harmonia axyridis]XP_045477260.1 neutral ceramidase [Harmonia axyridis]XP_045477269.1 neutral ceramidase [Harmonia axyridis]
MKTLLPSTLIVLIVTTYTTASYQVGIGIYDCTGPAAGVTFMGYAKSSQVGCGIHLRQFARAFIIDDGKTRIAYVTVDTCMISHGLKKEVLSRLRKRYNDTYGYQNVILSGTHTHSAPGGFMMDMLYDIPDKGFVGETFMALADGITKAVIKAHANIVEAQIYVTAGEIVDANINRSPYSYLNNPEEERAKYKYNTDKDIVQLKFVRSSDGVPIGSINWYAVHPTSMNNTNCLITSDNVGYASLLLEQFVNGGTIVGKGPFVGAFASTNLGDVSPNLNGPKCINTGKDCDFKTSTCDGEAKYCIASGPGKNMVESTGIIANRLFAKAKELFENNNGEELTGPVRFIHQFVDMPKQRIKLTTKNGSEIEVRGCTPAMGQAFAAGTTDGPGEFDFRQGTKSDNPIWNYIRDLIFPPSEDVKACHSPKEILINSGKIKFPYEWQPEIVATQLVMVGQIVLAAVPGEFTTMSGRRLRNSIKESIIQNGGPKNTRVIITGLSNVYTSYIATYEEYQIQRYEAASTIYGPHSLAIYQSLYSDLAGAMLTGKEVAPGPLPPDFRSQLISLTPPVIFDAPPKGSHFGKCTQQPPSEVKIGETVSAKFISGHPRNNVKQGKTFLTVEKQLDNKTWQIIYTDANWETRFKWKKTCLFKGTSEATVEWDITNDVEPGTYRLRHFGHNKLIIGAILPYSGTSNSFTVTK